MFDNEIPKHKKKKKSSVSKSQYKAKHKHEYVDCLLVDNGGSPLKASYCKICGKVGELKLFETEPIGNGLSKLMSKSDIYNKYHNLEIKRVNSIFDKYVSVD